MSKVVLIIDDSRAARTRIVALLRKHLRIGFEQALTAIEEKRPVIERPIFTREDPNFPELLLSTLKALDHLPISYSAFELLDDQTFVDQKRDTLYQLTADRLSSMIVARDKSLDWTREQARREDGLA